MNRNALAASRDGDGVMENAEVTGGVDEILTTGDAAILCGVSRSTLRRAVAQGHLRAWHTPGMHLRFSRAGCLAFAASLGQVDLVGRPYLEASRSVPVGAARAVEA
jgi:excisionase family DNA binding protein